MTILDLFVYGFMALFAFVAIAAAFPVRGDE